MQNFQNRSVIAALLLYFSATLAVADVRITMLEGTGVAGSGAEPSEGVGGTSAKQEPQTVVYWYARDRSARVDDSGRMISRLDTGESFFVFDQTKSYLVSAMVGPEGSSPTSDVIKLVKTDETRKIDSWNTIRYDMAVNMGGEVLEAVLWISDEIDIDLSVYRTYVTAAARQSGFDWMLKLLELDGFPVRQESRLGSVQTWQQLISISEETAPDGIYEPPAGYTRSEL